MYTKRRTAVFNCFLMENREIFLLEGYVRLTNLVDREEDGKGDWGFDAICSRSRRRKGKTGKGREMGKKGGGTEIQQESPTGISSYFLFVFDLIRWRGVGQ